MLLLVPFRPAVDKVILAIATARSEMAAKKYINKVSPDVVISNGGSLARYGEKIIHKCMLTAKTSDEMISEIMSKEECVSVSSENETGYYVSWDELNLPDYEHAIQYDFQVPLSQDSLK